MLRNLLRSTHRSDGRRQARERDAARHDSIPPEDEVLIQFEEQKRLAELIERLAERYRVVLLRHFYRGESCAQIARSTGQPSATVRSQLARALTLLRELHAREHGGDEKSSLAALGLAAGNLGALPVLPIATTAITSLFAMKLSTKVFVASATILVLGWVGRGVLRSADFPEKNSAQVATTTADLASPVEEPASAPNLEGGALAAERSPLAAPMEPTAVVVKEAKPRTALAMRIVDPSGLPISGARVRFTKRAGAPLDIPRSEPSDSNGRIVVDVERKATFGYVGDPARMSPILIAAPGRASLHAIETVSEGAVTELGDRVLERGGDLHGRVIDSEGIGVSGVEVGAMLDKTEGSMMTMPMNGGAPNNYNYCPRTTTGPRGEFSLEGLELRAYRLWFKQEGLRWNKSEPLTLEAGEVRRGVELVLPHIDESQLITGRVLLPTGAPATEARIRTRGDQMGFGKPWSDSSIGVKADGSFVYQFAGSGTLGFMAEHPGGLYSPSVAVEATPGGAAIELELNTLRRCRIVVVDEEDNPIQSAWMMPFIDDSGVGDKWLHSDIDGVHTLLLPGEEFMLRIGCTGFIADFVGPLDPFTLGDELVVKLVREQVVTGIVLADDKPVVGASVHLEYVVSETWRSVHKGFTSRFFGGGKDVETDEEGRFRVPLGEPEEYEWTLLVDKQGYARAEYTIGAVPDVAAVPEIQISLTDGGTLEGRLTVAPTRSIEGIVVMCSREDGMPLMTRTDATGYYRFEHLTPGGWLVEDREQSPDGSGTSVVTPDEMPFEPNATIREGAVTRLDLDTRWKDGLAIRGRLLFDGRGAQGWTATFAPGYAIDNPRTFEPVVLDEEGRFAAPAIPGPGSLMLRSPESDTVKRVIEWELLVGRDTPPVDLAFATATIRGTGREPGMSMRYVHQSEAGAVTYHNFSTDEEGQFEVKGLPVGDGGVQKKRGFGWEMVTGTRLVPGQMLTID